MVLRCWKWNSGGLFFGLKTGVGPSFHAGDIARCSSWNEGRPWSQQRANQALETDLKRRKTL